MNIRNYVYMYVIRFYAKSYHRIVHVQGSPEGPATGDFLRVLKRITPATNFGSILFLVQHFKCIFYRNKKAK